MQAKGLGREGVGEVLADADLASADPWDSVDLIAMDPVEVDCVRMRARVDEVDPELVAFAAA
jgi:hypothetical protein